MIIDEIVTTGNTYLNIKPLETKKRLGQFFTPSIISEYMSSMLNYVETECLKILDAGAGVGTLAISAALASLKNGNRKIHTILYEVDVEIMHLLRYNMDCLVEFFEKNEAVFTYEIRQEDFVLVRPDLHNERCHISVINPPYFKYNTKSSVYSGATKDLYKGDPNIYASFMAIVSMCLLPKGQMVAIVPRSFTNGLYFKGFRSFMTSSMSLNKIHLFGSRNTIFKDSAVLQENIICSYSRELQKKEIEIRTSVNSEDLKKSTKIKYPSSLIIDNISSHGFIRIPENQASGRLLKTVEVWPSNFQTLGYYVSTGPVVEHRSKSFITTPKTLKESIPLLKMHNLKMPNVEWTGENKKDVKFLLKENYHKHISKNRVYVLLKRFSSKDEKRRLVASVYNPKLTKDSFIAFENHINYIGCSERNFDVVEATGLSGLFNSTFMDKYFRCLSGSTQVNATEIRLLKLPNINTIQSIGKAILIADELDQNKIDNIVNNFIL